jgi:hypothetical protein
MIELYSEKEVFRITFYKEITKEEYETINGWID